MAGRYARGLLALRFPSRRGGDNAPCLRARLYAAQHDRLFFAGIPNVRGLATSSREKVLCLSFGMRESEAVGSFEEWTNRFAPTGDSSVVFEGCTPALMPFYLARNVDVYLPASSRRAQRLDETLATSGSTSCYGGRFYSRHIAEAAKPLRVEDWYNHRASSSSAAMSSGGNSPDRIEVDTWSMWGSNATDIIHRQIRRVVAETYQIEDNDETIRVEIERLEKYMVPAYVFTYNRKGQSWNVLVGAISGRATGLIQFGLWDGVRTTARDLVVAARHAAGGNMPSPATLLWGALLILPRLLPPVGLAFLVISGLRALLVPSLVNLFTSRRVSMDTNSEWIERAADAFSSQWGTYDPSEEPTVFGSADFRETFLNWQRRQNEDAKRFAEDFRRRVQEEEERARRQQQRGGGSYEQQRSSGGWQQQQQQQQRQSQSSSPPSSKSPYEVLGVPRTASQTDISKAYRRKLLLWHPDQNVGKGNQAECERKTQEIVAAYRELSSHKRS